MSFFIYKFWRPFITTLVRREVKSVHGEVSEVLLNCTSVLRVPHIGPIVPSEDNLEGLPILYNDIMLHHQGLRV